MIQSRLASLAAATLAVAALAFVWISQGQSWLLLDGEGMLTEMVREKDGPAFWYHLIVLPFGEFVARFLPPDSEFTGLIAAAAIAAALSLVLLWSALRRAGITPIACAAGVVLLATAPALWFHATIVEVHTYQLLGSALALLAMPWLTRASSLPGTAAAALALGVLLFSLHRANLFLFPGLVLCPLAVHGIQRATIQRTSVLLASLATATWFGFYTARFVTLPTVGEMGGFRHSVWLVSAFGSSPSWHFVFDEFIAAAPGLIAIGALGLAWLRPRASAELSVAALMLAPLVFFVFYAEPTRGGYFLSVYPMLAYFAALFVQRLPRVGVLMALVAVVTQSLLIPATLHSEQRVAMEKLGARRLAIADELLPEGGVLVGTDFNLQVASGRGRPILEYSLAPMLAELHAAGEAPSAWMQTVVDGIQERVRAGDAVVVDWNWQEFTAYEPALESYMQDFRRLLQAGTVVEGVAAGGGQFLRVVGVEQAAGPVDNP